MRMWSQMSMSPQKINSLYPEDDEELAVMQLSEFAIVGSRGNTHRHNFQ